MLETLYHGSEHSSFFLAWSWEPNILIGIAVAACLYGCGWYRLRSKARRSALPEGWRAWCFAGGLGTIFLALLSPIDAYGDLLFFMHMIQHLLLMLVAPVLLWLGAPMLPMLWAFPRELRRGIGRLLAPHNPVHLVFHWLTNPLVAAALYLIVVAVWHLPMLYNAAQGDDNPIHDLEHLMFLGAGLLFWWPVLHPSGGRKRLRTGTSVFYVLIAASEGGLIGGIFTFSDRVIYTTYLAAPRVWGISALTDQLIGGMVMWLAGGLIYIAIALILFVKMAMDEEKSRAAVEKSVAQAETGG